MSQGNPPPDLSDRMIPEPLVVPGLSLCCSVSHNILPRQSVALNTGIQTQAATQPGHPTVIQTAWKAPARGTFWSYRKGVQVRQMPTRKGLELSHLTNGREGWLAGVSMRPGHTEEGVRLRESLPLPNISQMLSEQLPRPTRPPGAHRERSSIVSSRPLLLIVSSMGGSSKLESNKRGVGGGGGHGTFGAH